MKTDQSIRNITIAAIERSLMTLDQAQYTAYYQEGEQLENTKIINFIKLEEQELLICSTIISEHFWSVLTTRRIITVEGLKKYEHSLASCKQRSFGDFKGFSKQSYTRGFLHFQDDVITPFVIETGNPSMVMVYGIDVAIRLSK